VISYQPLGRKFKNNPPANALLEEVSSGVFIDSARHFENSYLDYDHERLIPHASSTEGPRIVRGDVNGDRKEDFILLGASGQADQLFVFRNGKYGRSAQKDFESDKAQESVCGALFDSDKDGDLDYVVGSGGNEYEKGVQAFSSRFYVNDGKGNFTKATTGPLFSGQIGCIRANDFDNDGDVDLFVGASGVPGNYGLTPRSFLLRNNGSTWTDVTSSDVDSIGMVKDAEWFDFNSDGAIDLIVAGEWMPVTVFLQEKGTFRKGFEIPESHGWWNVIEMGDLDGDGDQDFALGNWGENMKLQASLEKPLNLYQSDFDNNGRNECILEWQFGSDEKAFPFASKKDLTGQLPMLKKKSLKYQEYAKKQVHEIIRKEAMDKATKLTTNNLRSSILLNKGKSWELRPLPFQAQLSPLFALAIADVDGDHINDILFGGNYYKLKPEIGRLDGFDGGYLRGTGSGNFEFVDSRSSGIKIAGEVRDITLINGTYFFARNNQTVVAVKAKPKILQ
jgi:enediyne biosynthesis protein E4